MSDNIYYTSNSYSFTYIKNNRASFKNNLDQSYFSHMKGGNIYAAVKSVTFDNTFETVIEEISTPHLVIIQLNISKEKLVEECITHSSYFESMSDNVKPNIESGNDYLFYNFNPPIHTFINPAIGKHSHTARGFTDLKIYVNALKSVSAQKPLHFVDNVGMCHVIHYIYLHPTIFKTSKDFVGFINNMYHQISFDPIRTDLSRNLIRDILYYTNEGKCLFFNVIKNNIKIYLHSSIARVLGFTLTQSVKNDRKKRSLDYTIMIELERQKKAQIKLNEENMNSKENNKDMTRVEEEYVLIDHKNSIIIEEDQLENNENVSVKKPEDENIKRVNKYFEYERFGGYKPPKLFGQISFRSGNNINELLFDMDGIAILLYSNTPTYIRSLIDIKDSYEYYHIDHSSKFEYILSENFVNTTTYKSPMLALRASYTIPDICNNKYDTLVAFINSVDLENGVVCQEYKVPTYYLTTIEKLCSSEFNLIDVQTGKLPKFSTGHPTYIHIKLKREKRMHKQFNAFFDSSDKESLIFFPNNINTDFRIRLPQRLEFNRNWQVCLKSIFIGNDLFNIYQNSCYIECSKINNGQVIQEDIIRLTSGRYENIISLLEYINILFKDKVIPIILTYINERVLIKYSEQDPVLTVEYSLLISPHLSMILGLSRNLDNAQNIHLIHTREFSGTYEIDLDLLTPQNYMVLSDIVESSVFGNGKINILKMLSSKYNKKTKIIHFDSYIDEFIPLSTYDFSMIRFNITDSSGNTLQTTGKYPTRLKLQFIVK